MSGFGRRESETTSDWPERLIAKNAPAYVISATQAMLENEKEAHESHFYLMILRLIFI